MSQTSDKANAARNAKSLEVPVAALLAKPGECRQLSDTVNIGKLATSTVSITGQSCDMELTLEALTSGEVMVWGELKAPWQGECRRCLQPVDGELEVKVKELFERNPTEGETYLLSDDTIHLAQMICEALLLNLPLAPLCSVGCQGPDPKSFAVRQAGVASSDHTKDKDPRWAALDELVFDSPTSE